MARYNKINHDFTGQRFGRLTALRLGERTSDRKTRWLCQCACGNTVSVAAAELLNRQPQSCGCLRGEKLQTRNHKHGQSRTLEYGIWSTMKSRCQNPKTEEYKNYGGRGIKVCKRWQSFANFFEDMGPRPTLNHSLDRKNNDADYEKSNCCWATRFEQNTNKRTTHLLTFDGETLSVTEWAQRIGMSVSTLYHRVRHGWKVADALTVPVRKR